MTVASGGKMSLASACGKAILLGEHAVVYGRPAVAVPLTGLTATVRVRQAPAGSGFTIEAQDIDRTICLSLAPPQDPLAQAVQLALHHFDLPVPDARLDISSSIPIGGGLGSGAAVAAATIRAVAAYVERELSVSELNELVFGVEKLHHGTPSGIDNTVVSYEQPVLFSRSAGPSALNISRPLHLIIADTGLPSSTREAVAQVRELHAREPDRLDRVFDRIGDLVHQAHRAIVDGEAERLGTLMDMNQVALREIGVSSLEIERLIEAALNAGALGAKLSGAGCGGNVIALVAEPEDARVCEALRDGGAAAVLPAHVAMRDE